MIPARQHRGTGGSCQGLVGGCDPIFNARFARILDRHLSVVSLRHKSGELEGLRRLLRLVVVPNHKRAKKCRPQKPDGRHSRLRVPNCGERLVSDIKRSRIQEIAWPAGGVVRVSDLGRTIAALNGRWRSTYAGRVVTGTRPDVMAAATTRQKAYGCQNEEQAIHGEFPRAFAGTALGRFGGHSFQHEGAGALRRNLSLAKCLYWASPIGLIGLRSGKIEQIRSIPTSRYRIQAKRLGNAAVLAAFIRTGHASTFWPAPD